MSDDGDDHTLVVLDPARVTVRKVRKDCRYTEALAQEICDTIATSSLGIVKLCDMHRHWPSFVTLYNWRNRFAAFNQLYLRAMQMRAAMFMDEIVQIADDAANDLIEVDGKWLPNPVSVQRAKLRCEFRKEVARKLDPHTWGEKTDSNAQFGYMPHAEAIRQLK
jgi:hypothetical protein